MRLAEHADKNQKTPQQPQPGPSNPQFRSLDVPGRGSPHQSNRLAVAGWDAEHLDVLAADHAVALARGLVQLVHPQYRDVAAPVLNEATILQAACDAGYA